MSQDQPSPPRNVVAELAYHFRGLGPATPVLLLGAGASYRSGVPLAAESVKRIAKASYAWTQLGMDEKLCNPPPSDWMPYLESHQWFIRDPKRLAENFPAAVQHLLIPRDRRRRFLSDLVVPPNGISEGYRALAQLMLRRLCCTVITTNFDRLVSLALSELYPNVREVVEVNRTKDDLVRFNLFSAFQIVYLHGAVEFYRDRNEEDETTRLDDDLVKQLRPLLRNSPLIAIGYRGYERSVMEHLLTEGVDDCNGYPHGIYWCRRVGSTNHENVDAFAKRIKGNFYDLEIDGFDELMVALEKTLTGYSKLLDRGGQNLQPAVPGASSFDQQPMSSFRKDDLDIALTLSTVSQYYERLRLGVFDPRSADAIMLELGILIKQQGTLVPSIGGYLLFGRDVTKHFPQAKIIIEMNSQQRLVIEGNLVTQFDALTGFLNSLDVNPMLRIKGQSGSYDEMAYAPLALRESCVNLLIHRDYSINELSSIEVLAGRHMAFTNPGGLLTSVAEKLIVASDGTFTPKRGVTGIRNPMLADIFYGLGRMDKAGSGLADIIKFMAQQGGKSIFSSIKENSKMVVTLKQAAQEQPTESNTAVPLNRLETFITNLLPFVVMPQSLTIIPLRHRREQQQKVPLGIIETLPQFIYARDHVISFAAPESFVSYPEGDLLLDATSVESVGELFEDKKQRHLIVWLLHRHWAHFLWQFSEDGLVVESRGKRAFFVHRSPYANAVSYVSYTSRMGRRIKRGVVKQRGALDKVWHENEGIQYAAVSIDNQWAFQLKPTYVFTTANGSTPLPGHTQTRRSTQRFKFDRNKSVEDDLTFWSRYLSSAGPVINIGGIGVDNLVLSANYMQAELPVEVVEEEN